MGLPSIIIAIILSALLIGIGTSYFGDVYADGAADATASTMANQGQQISQAIDTYRAREGGAMPGAIENDLVEDGYLEQTPDTGIDQGWVDDLSTVSDQVAAETDPGVGADICETALDNAGYGTPEDAPGVGEIGSLMFGCHNGDGTSDLVFFHK